MKERLPDGSIQKRWKNRPGYCMMQPGKSLCVKKGWKDLVYSCT
jgi:hypothetical protein